MCPETFCKGPEIFTKLLAFELVGNHVESEFPSTKVYRVAGTLTAQCFILRKLSMAVTV